MRRFFALVCLSCAPIWAHASILGTVRGLVHDPQHRPIAGAQVTVSATASHWQATTASNGSGEFIVPAVPIGEYTVTVRAKGFAPSMEAVTVTAGSAPILHFALALASGKTTVEVRATPAAIDAHSSTAATLVSGAQIERAPGATRANSLAMITDFIPGAVVTHDQLHIRGGHQVTWMLDGVPVPNTSIASNVGPQFNPANVEELEVQRGGYSAEYGNRTYAILNVVTRSGFERDNEGDLSLDYGSFGQTNDTLSFGSHTDRFAYYLNLAGNRSALGLETPTSNVLHDLASGGGGFGSFIFNADPANQLRGVVALRQDHYQVPNTLEQEAGGISDRDIEDDSYVNFTWLHTFSARQLLTVSPYYHFNRANYLGGAADLPFSPRNDRGSQYVGSEVEFSALSGAHNWKAGFSGFAEHDDFLFGLSGPGVSLLQRQHRWGQVEAAFVQDQYRATPWLTFNAGLRATRFAAAFGETAANPRLGVALRLPKLHWVARAYYGRFYQPPPLDTVAGPLLQFAAAQGFAFLPLHGERDEQMEAGLTIPWRGWALDGDIFRTNARNFFDHDVLGNSNIFLPLTIERARIHGWEATLRSPRLLRRGSLHLAFSHQYAQGFGGVSGGLTDFSPPVDQYYFLDHDQRNTLAAGGAWNLPHQAWADLEVNYGSGFLLGDGPDHLPSHTTVDLSVGKSLGERWTVGASALNIGNARYLLDTSNTFGGTHVANPREFLVQLRYRFHY